METVPSQKIRRSIPERYRWALILGEFAVLHAVVLVSIYQNWPYHNYLRFLLLIPLYHAGAAFGYNGSIMASLLVVALCVPLIPVDKDDLIYSFDVPSSIILLVFYVFFGIVVGGTVGAARKTGRNVELLSSVFMGIFGEPDERSVLLRSCREAASLTGAAGGAVLVRRPGSPDPSDWFLLDSGAPENGGAAAAGLPEDNILAWCAGRNAGFSTNCAVQDPRLSLGPPAAGVKSIIAAPVSFEDKVYGAILLTTPEDGEHFSARDVALARTIAETAGGAIHNMVQEKERQEEKLREEQLRELFSRFVSSSVADYVLEHPGLLEGRRQEVTVLVSDIRDFTAMAEKVPARALVAQLNEYFTAMVDVIFDNRGTIDKFIGDCIIAYWGAPTPDPSHAADAARAAAAMARALEVLNASWAARGMPRLSSGIAIHTCDVLIGNLGDDRKKTFTIMGEEVERAVRMESLTKTLGVKIIISGTSARSAGAGARLAALPGAPEEFGDLFTLQAENS